MRWRLALPLLLVACVGDGGSDSDPADGDCAALEEADCEARSDCMAIRGAPRDEVCAGDNSNWGAVFAGCVDDPGGCDDAIGCAEDPSDGTQLIFSNLCFPDGWTECETCP